jgi:predicted MFS family arabinose efflux permease
MLATMTKQSPDSYVPPVPTAFSIFLLAVASFASALAFRIGDPLLPQLSLEFNTSTGNAAHVVTAFAVSYGIAQFFYGPLGDRIGKYRTITLATLLCSIGSLGAAFAPSLEMLLFCRVLSGAAGAGVMPLALAWIGDGVPYERRQATMARFLIGSITGIAGGQVVGGLFADTLGWRYGFVFLAILYLSAGLALHVFRPAPHRAPVLGTQGHIFSSLVELFKVKWAKVVILVGFIEGAIVFGVLAFVPSYLQHRFGVSATIAGATGALFAVGGYGYVAFASWLVPRLGERGMVLSGGVILAVAFLMLLAGPVWTWALPAGLLCGFGYYLVHSTLQIQATQMAPKVRGTSVAMFASFLFTGQAFGAWAVAQISDSVGIGWAFALAMVLMPAVTTSFAMALKRRKFAG